MREKNISNRRELFKRKIFKALNKNGGLMD